MDIDPEIAEHIKKLADELQQLIQQYVLQDPELVEDKMLRSSEIIKEIQSLGFVVNWEVNINPSELELADVTIRILKPKDNLSPEDQEKYDEWFLSVAGIKNKPA